MFVFSNAFVNPLLAQSSKSTDKTGSSKSKDKSDGTKTSSSSSDKKDYKAFQKCLSDTAGTKGSATETEIQDCLTQIYSTTASSSTSTP